MRPVGGKGVLRRRLRHLADLISRHPHLVVQVAPLSSGEHPLLGGSIQILRFGGVVEDIVQQPTFIGGGVYLTDERDVPECIHLFDQLRAVALSPDESHAFITRRAKDLGHEE